MFSCRQPLPWHIPPTSPAASYDPRLLPKVSLHRGALHRVSLRDLETFHKCNAMTLFFSRYPEASLTLPYRSCLHCRVVQVLEVLQELPSHGSRRGRARALVDTGTTPTHTPPYSYAHASFGLAQLMRTSRLCCQLIFTMYSWFNAPDPLLLQLQPVESLSLILEGLFRR